MEFTYKVEELDPKRLDLVLAQNLRTLSRTQIQEHIKTKHVTCNGNIVDSCKHKTAAGDLISITYELDRELNWTADKIELNIIYEDADIYVLNKPAGLVMHPGAGQKTNTLANALIFHNPKANETPRAGIVHRLDKDTSGICICAKNNTAYLKLIELMKQRAICRKYLALVNGCIFAPGTIEAPIGRHPRTRTQMAVIDSGKYAKTNFKILKRFEKCTWLELELETGRTHQIRVHLAYKGYPIVGDCTYNKNIKQYSNIGLETINAVETLNRQALHAYKISFPHPTTNQQMSFKAPIPEDIQHVLDSLS